MARTNRQALKDTARAIAARWNKQTEDEETDDGVLRPGQSVRVPMMMRDGQRTSAFMRDVDGRPAPRLFSDDALTQLQLRRPGFRMLNADTALGKGARQVKQQAYRDHDFIQENSWRAGAAVAQQQLSDAQVGDPCTCKGEADKASGRFGAPGHLRMVNGELTCVPDRRADVRSVDPNVDEDDDIELEKASASTHSEAGVPSEEFFQEARRRRRADRRTIDARAQAYDDYDFAASTAWDHNNTRGNR